MARELDNNTAETLQALIDYDEFANVNALNMYNKYSMCADMMLSYEQKHEMKFHYFILDREDIYFFKKLDLAALLPTAAGWEGVEWTSPLRLLNEKLPGLVWR